MLDITQANCSLAMQTGAGATPAKAPLGTVARAESFLPLAVANCQPVVTWRVTRTCNPNCMNCVSASGPYGVELTTLEGMALIRDLAKFKVRRLGFASREPVMRYGLRELIA